jgi:hypothetical protein
MPCRSRNCCSGALPPMRLGPPSRKLGRGKQAETATVVDLGKRELSKSAPDFPGADDQFVYARLIRAMAKETVLPSFCRLQFCQVNQLVRARPCQHPARVAQPARVPLVQHLARVE